MVSRPRAVFLGRYILKIGGLHYARDCNFLKHYGSTEGPLGLPMQDRQAFLLESILKALPAEDRALKHAIVAKAPTELLDGERADVSWISTEEIDRDKEIDPNQPFIVPVAIDNSVDIGRLPRHFREINIAGAPDGQPSAELIAHLKAITGR